MSTGMKKVDIFLKKFLPQQQITENFFDLLENKIHESLFWVFRSQGVFTPDPTITPILSSPGANSLDFFTPLVGTDGSLGHILDLDPLDASAVPFENSIGILYHTGLRFNRLPTGTEVNVRTGKIKYSFLEEKVGEIGEPDAVVDDGDGTLTVTIDSVCEAGVSHAGRKAILWLKDAVSQVEAFEEVTVIFSGGANKIATTTALGQQIGNISVDPTKYQVFLRGPTIRRNTDLRLDPNVIYTGNVLGNGATPTVFDHSDVNNLSAGFSALSSLFYVEHSNVDGTHTDITPETITTKQAQPGVQLDTRVNAGDEDTPDAPVSHTLFQSTGGSGIQNVKWRLRDSSGAVIALIDAHGNAYFQNLAAITTVFQSTLTVAGNVVFNQNLQVDGNSVLGDDINTDFVTLNAALRSLTDMIFLIDSDNNETGKAYRFYNNTISALNEIFNIADTGDLKLFGNIYTDNPGLNIDLDSDNNTTGEVFNLTKNGGLSVLFRILETGKVKLFDSLFTDLAALSIDLDNANALTGEQFSFTKNNGATVLWLLNEFGDAIAARDQLTGAKTKYSNALGAAIPTNASLNETHDETLFRKLLKVTPNNPNDKAVNIASARMTAADGSDFVMPTGVLVSGYLGGTANFQTGAQTGGGPGFTPIDFTGQASQWAKYSLNLLVDNTILVLPAEGFGATKAAAPNPTLARGAVAFTVVAVQDNGAGGIGTINNISEANFDRLPAAGGGSGGSGNANLFEIELNARLKRSTYGWFASNIASQDEDDYIDDPNSDATFDIANQVFKFPLIGDILQTIQSYGEAFLSSERDNEKVEAHVLFGSVPDPGMTVELSRDNGLNWLAITMAQLGISKHWMGSGVFPDPVNTETLKEYPAAVTPTAIVMTNLVFSRAVKITVTEKSNYRTYLLKYSKTGTPSGSLFINLVKDSAGSPSTSPADVVASSDPIAVSSLLGGSNNLSVDVLGVLPPGAYWFVIASDAGYRTSYSAGVHEVAIQADSAGTYVEGASKEYDGTTWTTTANRQILFTTTGFRYILLSRLTSSVINVTIEGHAVLFGENGASPVPGIIESEIFRFAGSLDKTEFDVTSFLPDPRLCSMEFVNAGLHFVYPFFDMQGKKLIVKAGTFLYPATPELIVKIHQRQGSAFDNSEPNASLLAANHLGSTDPSIDMSSAGRGILLRRRGDGVMRELIINETDDIEILAVP